MDALLPGLGGALNWHPLFVHFPIALWPAALVFLTYGALVGSDTVWKSGTALLYAATAAAALTVASGYRAADALGHDSPGHDLVHVHRDFMLVALVLSIGASMVAAYGQTRDSERVRPAVLGGLLLVNVVGMLGADRGANLVFRYGVGVAHEAPPAADGHAHDHGDGHGHDAPAPSPSAPTSAPPDVPDARPAAPPPAAPKGHEGHDHAH